MKPKPEEKLPTCSSHRWSNPRPVWLEDAISQDPTQMRVICLDCEASETVQVKVGGHQ